MKALVYEKAHSLADFAIKLVEIPVPTLRDCALTVSPKKPRRGRSGSSWRSKLPMRSGALIGSFRAAKWITQRR
jgi:hypothetical protein